MPAGRSEHRRGAVWIDALVLVAVAVVLPLLIVRGQLRPSDLGRGVAVVYAPWVSAAEAAARASAAGARLVAPGRYGFVWIVKPETAAYAEDALASGALLVVDPDAFPFCSPAAPAA